MNKALLNKVELMKKDIALMKETQEEERKMSTSAATKLDVSTGHISVSPQ